MIWLLFHYANFFIQQRWNFIKNIQWNKFGSLVDLHSLFGFILSKRPSYTACLDTLKGVYQSRLISSGLKQDCENVLAHKSPKKYFLVFLTQNEFLFSDLATFLLSKLFYTTKFKNKVSVLKMWKTFHMKIQFNCILKFA